MTQIHSPAVPASALCHYESLRVGKHQGILTLTEAPRFIENAIVGQAKSRIPIPPAALSEPEEVGASSAKGFAYRALSIIVEHYWSELVKWRLRNPSSIGLALPEERNSSALSEDTLRSELRTGATPSNPGAVSTNLRHRIEGITRVFAHYPFSEPWLSKAESDPESAALASYLKFSPVSALLTAGVNSALARTFDLQAQVLSALAAAAEGNAGAQENLCAREGPEELTARANAALSILSSPDELARHMSDLHKMLKYFSSLHRDHFTILADWLRERPGPEGQFRFTLSADAPQGVVGLSNNALAELHSRLANCVPNSPRHGCPASAARSMPAAGNEIRPVISQTFAWIEEINGAFLFPLVAELYSRKAPSAVTLL